MEPKTYIVKPSENLWSLAYDKLEFLFPIRGDALTTAIKAARLAAVEGGQTRVVLQSHDASVIEVWRSASPAARQRKASPSL
ncbi:hypothetical protein ACFSM5_08055 [Lacibacterium aquatile]|uniref:DUF2188 domain-containing protein n=1 Tax=Lacibacterium aquatile TaxID=1168082 RepID=A0ABW5DP00_9PROT